jgi:drug/metabolite transporter (DMT)-like permease
LIAFQGVGTLYTLVLVPFASEAPPTPEALAWAAVSGVVGLVGVACLFLALSRGAMGLVSPLTALVGAVIPALVGIVNGDPAGPALVLGMLVALAAVVVISLPAEAAGTPSVPTRHGSRAAVWLLMLGAGLGAAGFYIAIDQATAGGLGPVSTLLAVRLVSMVLLAGALAAVWARASRRGRRLRVPRLLLPLGALGGFTDTSGTLLYVGATTFGSLSMTVVLVSLYPVATAILARVVLHERLSRVRLMGVGLAILGVMLIGLGALHG